MRGGGELSGCWELGPRRFLPTVLGTLPWGSPSPLGSPRLVGRPHKQVIATK